MMRASKKIVLTLLENRISVSMVMLILVFVVFPPLMLFSNILGIDKKIENYDNILLIILSTYVIILLCWHIGSAIFQSKLNLKPAKGEIYDNGFEIIASINTFGLGKYIGYDRLKNIFASFIMSLATFIAIAVILSFINFDIVIWALETGYISPFIILALAFLYYPFNKKHLR
ncbi:MAG: hypothetical protein ABFR97_10640 [Thermodesulfobacteriota bacterium]